MRFEDLTIRQEWRKLNNELWKIFYNKDFKNYSFQDQIMRASISVTNNIAEGFERSSMKEKIQFLYYAKWSIGEVRSMLYLGCDFWYITKEQEENFIKSCISLSVKIHNYISSIKPKST